MAGGVSPEARGAGIAEIVSRSVRDGVDPLAALAVAAQEGLGGGIGDGGTSFGPFQLHQGGAYPASAPQDQAGAQTWAWSTAGIDYAIDHIAGVARGQQGPVAVSSIVTGFERPKDPQTEISRAVSKYHALQAIQPPIVSDGHLASGSLPAIDTAGSGSATFNPADPSHSGAPGVAAAPVDSAANKVTDAAQGALDALSFPERLFKFLTSWRFVEVVGGFLLLLVGVALLARQFGLNVPVSPPGLDAAQAAAGKPTAESKASTADTFQFAPGEAVHNAAQPTSRQGTGKPRKTRRVALAADKPAYRSTSTPVMSDSIPY